MADIIKSRRSIRAFEKKVPSQEIIKECLEAATWAPSATNRQPWEFIVLTGKELEKINDLILEHFAERIQERAPYEPLPEHLEKRQQEIFDTLLEIGEKEGIEPNEIFLKSLRFFDAPVAVYFLTYKSRDDQYKLSTAAALENFLLAAEAKGLGTCWLTVTVICEQDTESFWGFQMIRSCWGALHSAIRLQILCSTPLKEPACPWMS
jgi:nitroreductase